MRRKVIAAGMTLGVAATAPALAQQASDVGTLQAQGEGLAVGSGYIVPEDAPKARSTASRQAVETQLTTASPYQIIQQLPGVNAFTNDPTGLYGGQYTMRGFNSDQIGFTVEGAPLNDSGNYAVYPAEYIDAENLDQIYVTQGSPDVDAPHIGATGGNLGIVVRNPSDQFGGRYSQTVGELGLFKEFIRLDTGKIAGTGLKAFASYSNATSDKWRGLGGTERNHVDAKAVYDTDGGSHYSLGVVYNRQLTNFYNDITLSQYHQFGSHYDYALTYPSTQYYKLYLNPYENALVTAKANMRVTDNLQVDFEPYYWYGHGSGIRGGNTFSPSQLGTGTSTTGSIYASNGLNYNFRPGATVRATYRLDNQKFVVGYWYERARLLRETVFSAVNPSGQVIDPWVDQPHDVLTLANGTVVNGSNPKLNGTNWFTRTTSQQWFAEDTISLLGDRLKITVGVRQPHVERDGDDRLFYAPVKNPVGRYQKTLPSAAVSFAIDDNNTVFANMARTFRAPGFNTLYDGDKNLIAAEALQQKPETSWNYEAGYRYAGQWLTGSAVGFFSEVTDRQFAYYIGQDPLNTYDLNIGRVRNEGAEFELGSRPFHNVSAYASMTYTKSILENDFNDKGTIIPTRGKNMVNVPRWSEALTIEYRERGKGFFAGLQPRCVSGVYSTLVNDEHISGHCQLDGFAGYVLADAGPFKGAKLQVNVSNLTQASYLQVASNGGGAKVNARTIGNVAGAAPYYDPSAPFFIGANFVLDF